MDKVIANPEKEQNTVNLLPLLRVITKYEKALANALFSDLGKLLKKDIIKELSYMIID